MQIFSRAADTYLRVALAGGAALVVGSLLLAGGVVRSDWITGANFRIQQPVPFSHKHHVGQLGIDCRYCHASVEVAASAGNPPTHTCMTCHSQLWTGADALAPVRQSLVTGEPLRWNRVYDLPDYVYFNHSIHVSKGIGCTSCHGPIDTMDRVYQAPSLHMQWCLDCHRHPEEQIRPPSEVFNTDWHAPAHREQWAPALVAELKIPVPKLDNCYTCHR